MTDIQQWRRKIQSTRVRTPAAIESEEAEPVTTPVGFRKPFRPTFTTDNSQPRTVDPEVNDASFGRLPSWIADAPAPNPSLEQIIDSIMCNVLQDPFSGLTAQFASDLMRLIEGYQDAKDEKDQLQAKLDHEIRTRRGLEVAWSRERQEYKDEIKRLVLILSKGKRGLAEVTLARRNSLLSRPSGKEVKDDGGLKTVLDALERSMRYKDKRWSSQRAMMRRRSTSADMQRLSKSFATLDSPMNALNDLPSGTPPFRTPSILQQAACSTHFDTMPLNTSNSNDTLSTFSGGCGDLLPDEIVVHDQEATAQQGVPVEASSPLGLGLDIEQFYYGARQTSIASVRKIPSLKARASEFLLSKFKTQVNDENTSFGLRKFSFEAGDDLDGSLGAIADALPPAVKDRLLCKSASMSSLEIKARKDSIQEASLSQLAQSPATSATPQLWTQTPPDYELDTRRPSRIPTPTYRQGSCQARARREREDSSSSFLTAIHYSDEIACRSNSISSSAFSSSSGSRLDLTHGAQGVEIVGSAGNRTHASNRLLDHTNALRGNAFAAAAARTVTGATDPSVSCIVADHLSSGRSSNNSRQLMHVEVGKENGRPMAWEV